MFQCGARLPTRPLGLVRTWLLVGSLLSLADELEKACAQRLHAPAAETLHIAHVLSQAVAGLLAGANDGIEAKAEHVFAAADPEQLAAGNNPVRHWVARLEFQDGKRARHGAIRASTTRAAVSTFTCWCG